MTLSPPHRWLPTGYVPILASVRAQICVSACALCLALVSSAQTAPALNQPAPTITASSPASVALNAKQKSHAEDAFLAGVKELDRRDYIAAEKHFARAVQLNPGNSTYITALALNQEHHVTDLVQQAGRARLLGDPAKADALLAQARAIDPQNTIVTQHTDPKPPGLTAEPWLLEAPTFAGAISLKPTAAINTFHQRADIQQIVRVVAAGYGIRPVFDDSVTPQSVRLDLDDATYTQAMPILLQMGHLFAVPLDPTTILIARDTIDNRLRLERQMQETIYVPGMTPEQMSDLGNVVRNIFDIKQATVENTLGNIVIRAPEQTLNAVNLTLTDLLDNSNEILIEMKLYSVDITHGRTTGLSLPTQIGAYNVATQAQALVTANQSIVNQAIAQGLISPTATAIQIAGYLIGSGIATSTLLSNTLGIFGGGITTTGVYATGGATLNFGLTSSDTRALDDIELRATDHHEAIFRVGTRYPITTSTYSTGVAANSSSLAGVTINGVSASNLLSQYLGSGSSQTIPQVQYEDLGLTLKATPAVTKNGEVHLKLDLKIEALAGGSIDNIPILNNRELVSEVTVKDGETALLLSNLNRSETRAINGLPGLSELPGFQDASELAVEADSSRLILLLTPRIVRHRRDNLAGPRIAFTPVRVPN